MSEANKMQVGGTHYKTDYEHWDWVIENSELGAVYLVGVATKYVARWRKKGGVEDLDKALHYVNKLIESAKRGKVSWRRPRGGVYAEVAADTQKFANANGLSDQEADFCQHLMIMYDIDDFYSARDILLAIIEQADEARPVPLEDSNKHADRDYAGAVTGRMPGVPHGE